MRKRHTIQMPKLSAISSTLSAALVVMAAVQSPCEARLFWHSGLAYELGAFSELSFRGREAEEWRGLGGGPLLALSILNEVGWDRISIDVELPWYLLIPLSTQRYEADAVGAGGFKLTSISAGYWFPVQPQVELQPVAGFWWMGTEAIIEVEDPENGKWLREVEYSDWQKGLGVGLSARLWQSSGSSGLRPYRPKFGVQYRLADLSETVHMVRIEIKFCERGSEELFVDRMSTSFVANIHLQPSINTFSVGVEVDAHVSSYLKPRRDD